MNADIRGFSVLQQRKALFWLVFFHIAVIATSNYLVQFPFTVTLPNGYEVHSTWGALSFPFIFLATDLTVRIFGRRPARRVVFFSMFPALLLSYAISVTFHQGIWQGTAALAAFDGLVFRIAAASFAAYAVGQLLDTFVGNAVDTLLFFAIAFHAGTDAFMAENWPQIAVVDYLFKLVICTLFFLPAYGLMLNILVKKITVLPSRQ